MTGDVVVLRDDDARLEGLLASGWEVAARSWGARVERTAATERAWRAAVAALPGVDVCTELTAADVPDVLALDAATLGDYPGGVATAHAPLTPKTARPTASRRAFGVRDAEARLVAFTYVDVADGGAQAEVDVTVVAPDRRRQGLGSAVKGASLVGLAADGVRVVRTGGSAENAGILAANRALGFVVDEQWLTLKAPTPQPV